jgi:tetratricopeptide (TPR) repeat protein
MSAPTTKEKIINGALPVGAGRLEIKNFSHSQHAVAGIVALISLLVYLPALQNAFVGVWDDNDYVAENSHIRSLDMAFFRWAFFDSHSSNWHPITWISHAVDYALWGLNPLGHHLTSIILHAINTALVILLAVKLLETARERSISLLNDRTVLIAAGVAGLLFGIHPVHVESVAWVSERKDLLCALFFLLSIMAYTKYAVSQQTAAGSRQSEGEGKDEIRGKNIFTDKHYLLALGFFILALMSKPMAVSLPVVLLILDWYPFDRVRSWKTLRSAGVEKLPFITLSFISSIVTISAQSAGKAFQTIDFVPLSMRALVAAKSLVAYLGKMLLPINLFPFYPYPKDTSPFSIEYLSALALIVFTTAAVIAAKRQRAWSSAWGFYVITLIPVLGIVQVGGQAMADRYTYLPSLGPFLVTGLCVAWIVEKSAAGKKTGSIVGKAGIAIALLLVVSLSSLTIRQITVWRDSFSLWTSVIEKRTEGIPMAYVNRGAAFQKKGLLEKAVADYETAIGLDPSDSRAYISLGAALDQMGHFDRAKDAVERAIALDPSSHEAFRNRGLLFEKMGRLDEAITDYARAIVLRPAYYEAYNNRGLAYAKIGQFDKAIADYSRSIAINPRYFNAFVNRGVAFTLTAQYDRALEDFNRAILLDQDDAVAYYNRGMFYRRMGNNDLARSDVRKACELGNERACGALHQLTQGINFQ